MQVDTHIFEYPLGKPLDSTGTEASKATVCMYHMMPSNGNRGVCGHPGDGISKTDYATKAYDRRRRRRVNGQRTERSGDRRLVVYSAVMLYTYSCLDVRYKLCRWLRLVERRRSSYRPVSSVGRPTAAPITRLSSLIK